MKTKLSFLARSVILLWMLVVGSSNAWAEWAEVSYDGNTYIYFNNIKPSGWDVCWKAAGSNVYAYFYNAGGGEQWTEWAAELVSGTQDAEGAVYRIKVPQGTWKAVILSRGTATGWEGRWGGDNGQTNDITLLDGKNYLKNYGQRGTSVLAEWDNYSTTVYYTVTYNINNGTGTTPTQGNVEEGGNFTVAGSDGFSRANYTFASWNTNADGTGTNYSAGASYENVTSNVTLYAKWYPTVWKVHYNLGASEWPDLDLTTTDGNIYTGTLHIEKDKTVPFKVYTTDESWYGNNGTMTRSDCTDWSMTTETRDCELKADVTGNYVFTFNASTKKMSVTYPEDMHYYINHPWNGDNDHWDWKKLNDNGNGTYSLEDFYGNDGCNWNTKSGNEGQEWIEKSKINFVDAPEKGDKCTFTLNPSDNDGKGSLTISKITYTITYNLNSGTNPADVPTTYSSGTAVTLPTPTRNGYTFEGWFDNESCTGSVVTEIAIGSTGNKTFWAKWTEKVCYITLAFRTEGAAAEHFNTKTASSAWFWQNPGQDGTWPGENVTTTTTKDGHRYFCKTYSVPYGSNLDVSFHSISDPGAGKYDTRAEEQWIYNATEDKTYYYVVSDYITSVDDYHFSFYKTTLEGGEPVINVSKESGSSITNTTPIKISVANATQWKYSVDNKTPITVMDGHTSEWAYMPVGEHTLKVTAIASDGTETTESFTYTVTDAGNVITVYWDNYQPDCKRAECRVENTDSHDKPALDQAYVWYQEDTEYTGFAATDNQGARLDTEGRFLYANISIRPGKYKILFRNKTKDAPDTPWSAYYQTVEFTGKAGVLYGPVMTTGTNTFKVKDTHFLSETEPLGDGTIQYREMWEVDYFDPSSSVTFNPATVTVTKTGDNTSAPVGTKATIYDNATVTITPENVTSWRYKLNDGSWSEYLNSTSEDLDIEKLIKEGKITADDDGEDNTITVELVYALNSAKSISKEVIATYSVKKPEAKVNVHVSFPYGYWHENKPVPFNGAQDYTIKYDGCTSAGTIVDGTGGTATLKKNVELTENDPKFYEWYSTSIAVAGADVDKISLLLQEEGHTFASRYAENGTDVYFVVVYINKDATSDHTTLEAAIDAEVDLPIITATPSQTFIGSEPASASYEVKKAYTATLNDSDLSLTAGATSGSITVPTTGTTTMTIKAVNSAGYPLEVTRTYDVNTSDLNGYYLVVNNTRSAGVAGTNIVKYKFQPVLNRNMATPDLSSTLYTLTLPDFVLTGAQGRKENPNCFNADNTMYYTIQKGDGTVIYQPTSSTVYGNTYYAGHNETGHKYLYIWNEKEPNKEHYISVNGADRVMMQKDDNMRINGHGPIWYYDFGDGDQSSKYFNVTIDYNPGNVLTNWYLYGGNNSTFVEAKLDGTWSGTAIIAPDEDKTITPGKDYELGYEDKKFTENSNGNLTNVQMESYGAHINKSKADADAEGYNFFLKKDKLAKSYTWYLNIGNSAYAPSDHNPRFTSNAQSVAIAANQLVDGHAKNAIVEQNNAKGVQDYFLTGNLKAGADAFTWQPVENKMKMTRMFFKDGKSTAVAPDAVAKTENCDSIVYVLQMVRPEAGWGNMYLSMAGERNLDAYSNGISSSNTEAWWATLIRPQVFTDKDAQWNFGGLEVNGILNDNGSYTTSYANTSQAINPILDNTVTGYTAYFNMTNATYRLVYYTESESNDEGLFIIGPAVGETTAEHPYNAKDGQKVKLTFDAPTGAYVAKNVKLTYDKKFRFANIKASTITTTTEGGGSNTEEVAKYESYYDEDAIVPARDGEPGNTDWLTAKTWETDYFNILSKQKNVGEVETLDDSDDAAVTFKLPTGTYNVRFYTKYLGANGETVTNAYYTIDYHIGIGDATIEGNVDDETGALPSEFHYHKTWSSRLAYVNDNSSDGRLDIYYIKDWTYSKTDKNDAKAVVTFGKVVDNTYIPSGMPMILSAKEAHLSKTKTFVIVPGDPYGLQSSVQSCKATSTNKVDVHPVFETENYNTGRNAEQYSEPWLEWSKEVGPGEIDKDKLPGKVVYKTRNFIFGMITPNWRRDTKKELNFWRMKASNYHVTGHKILVKAKVPAETNDYESGATYSGYQSGANAKSMANMMSFVIEGDEIDDNIVTSITDIEDVNNDNRIYNLMGVEVKSPIRGQVYIINGRKTIIK